MCLPFVKNVVLFLLNVPNRANSFIHSPDVNCRRHGSMFKFHYVDPYLWRLSGVVHTKVSLDVQRFRAILAQSGFIAKIYRKGSHFWHNEFLIILLNWSNTADAISVFSLFWAGHLVLCLSGIRVLNQVIRSNEYIKENKTIEYSSFI